MDRTNMHSSNCQSSAAASPDDQGNNPPYMTKSNELSDDSGFVSADSQDTSPFRPETDFQLYDSDVDFLDEEASTFPNHGSSYQISNVGRRPSQTSNYSSSTSHPSHDQRNRRPDQGRNLVYQSTEPNGPSLFGEYRAVYATGPNQLQQWQQVEPYRFEKIACHFESLPNVSDSRYYDEDIRLTPEPAIPTPRSPKHRKSKSGNSTSSRRQRKH